MLLGILFMLNFNPKTQAVELSNQIKAAIKEYSKLLNLKCDSACDMEERDMYLDRMDMDFEHIADQLRITPECFQEGLGLSKFLIAENNFPMAREIQISLAYTQKEVSLKAA
jgi:hypothetical protein